MSKQALIFRLVLRLIHITAALVQFSILFFECCFDLQSLKLHSDPAYGKMKAVSGLGMLFSGIMLTGAMYKEQGVIQPLAKKWRGYHVVKFFISLILTPFFDKFAFLVTGGFETQRDFAE